MRRRLAAIAAFSGLLASACGEVVVDVIGASAVQRLKIPEFASSEPQDAIELVVARPDFEKHIGTRGSLGLYASDCRSDRPAIRLGSRVGPGRPDPKLGGYRVRFVLEPLQANAYYSADWAGRLKCVYMKTGPDYDPTTYRSNVVRVGTA